MAVASNSLPLLSLLIAAILHWLQTLSTMYRPFKPTLLSKLRYLARDLCPGFSVLSIFRWSFPSQLESMGDDFENTRAEKIVDSALILARWLCSLTPFLLDPVRFLYSACDLILPEGSTSFLYIVLIRNPK
jgi:hypothetical protein